MVEKDFPRARARNHHHLYSWSLGLVGPGLIPWIYPRLTPHRLFPVTYRNCFRYPCHRVARHHGARLPHFFDQTRCGACFEPPESPLSSSLPCRDDHWSTRRQPPRNGVRERGGYDASRFGRRCARCGRASCRRPASSGLPAPTWPRAAGCIRRSRRQRGRGFCARRRPPTWAGRTWPGPSWR